MPIVRMCVGAAIAMLLASCQSSLDPEIRSVEGYPFSQMKTFAWVSESPLYFHAGTTEVDPRLEDTLKRHTAEVLEGHGLTRVGRDHDPDVLISFSIGSRELINWRRPSAMTVTSDEIEEWGDFLPNHDLEDVTYREGQICIDVYSGADQLHVWHGTVREPVSQRARFFSDARVREIIQAILQTFPAK